MSGVYNTHTDWVKKYTIWREIEVHGLMLKHFGL